MNLRNCLALSFSIVGRVASSIHRIMASPPPSPFFAPYPLSPPDPVPAPALAILTVLIRCCWWASSVGGGDSDGDVVCLQRLVHELSLLEAHPPLSRLVVLIDAVRESDSHFLTQLGHVLAQQIYQSIDKNMNIL